MLATHTHNNNNNNNNNNKFTTKDGRVLNACRFMVEANWCSLAQNRNYEVRILSRVRHVRHETKEIDDSVLVTFDVDTNSANLTDPTLYVRVPRTLTSYSAWFFESMDPTLPDPKSLGSGFHPPLPQL